MELEPQPMNLLQMVLLLGPRYTREPPPSGGGGGGGGGVIFVYLGPNGFLINKKTFIYNVNEQ